MKNKWYRSKVTKAALIIAEHIFTILMILSVICMMLFPTLAEDVVKGRNHRTYEDSKLFEEHFLDYARKAVEGTHLQEIWETDGEYNKDKIVDIEEYWDTNNVSGENTSGLSFRIEELLQWDVDTANYETENEYIIVCEKKDGTFNYYTYAQFVSLIREGNFRLNGYLGEGENLFDYLEEMGRTRENFLQIQNEEGEVLFVNCWRYDGTYFTNQYKTVDGISILELVNTNEHWNGRLQDAFDMIRNCVYNFRESETAYWESVDNMEEGDTNFAFVYVDKTAGKVYSNRDAFKDYKKINNYVSELKKCGKYVVVTPMLGEFNTNMQGADASTWRSTVKYAGKYNAEFLFVAGVDTDYTIRDSFYTENQFYEGYGMLVKVLMVLGVIAIIPWLVGLIWLTVIAGRNSHDEEICLNGFDRWWTEPAAILIASFSITAAVAGGVLFSSIDMRATYIRSYRYDTGFLLQGLASAGLIFVAFSIFLAGYLSLVRRIKAGTLWKDSVLRLIVGIVKHALNHIKELWKILLVFVCYICFHLFLIFVITDGWTWTVIGVGLWIFVDILAGIYLVIYVIGREKIEQGIKRIAEGDVEYKISTEKMLPGHKKLAETVNKIGEGLDAAVEKSMRSERLKTDLITNVSHDIKTPLTSIINYIDLLKKENFQDPKIQHYIEVLEQKAQRLKVLTEDVVEASKVSSGNVTLEYMNINFVEMIQQTSGEFEEKFKKRRLQEMLKLPNEDVVIHVDGRRTWRILENIYNNAAKYAMEGSRVYADLKVADGKAVFELKNISEQPLNISADELTERFIRGDISRSTEGSGLGLSIARSLTEMQGGRFALYLDGDLFKVTIEFEVVS